MRKWWIIFLLLATVCLGANDPWEPYDSHGKGKGKGPPHPVVPEPNSYGAILVGSSLVLFGAHRLYLRHRNKSL
jgi:hypothetical protein